MRHGHDDIASQFMMNTYSFTRCLSFHARSRIRIRRRVLWAASCLGLVLAASTQWAVADIGATHRGLVSEFASFNTPSVLDGRVNAIAIDGNTVFVGGTFTQIQEPFGGAVINQPYLFAYNKTSGAILRQFDPMLDNAVFALETTGEGSGVFAGGVFGMLNGQGNRRGLLKLDNNGDSAPGFFARPDALVTSLVRLGNTLYVGGNFQSISQTPVEHIAALDTATGAVSPNLSLDFADPLSTGRVTGVQGVDDIDITSDGRLMVAIGNFQRVNGQSRTRLAVIELDGQARVSDWNTDVFDDDCPSGRTPQYILGIDIAPDNRYFLTATTGFRRFGQLACDTILRFDFGDLSAADVEPSWVNFTGGDSVYDVVATDHAVYAGGHFRWLNNDTSFDGSSRGPGAVERNGLAALDPKNGLAYLNWRSDRNPRGVGTFALIAEDEGLYIGDDTDFLNGSRHPKLKFLPITNNTITRPVPQSLPARAVIRDGDALTSMSFDGSRFSPPTRIAENGWGRSRGGVFINDQLFHADANGVLVTSRLSDGGFGTKVAVERFGLSESQWALSRLTGMYYDHERGRVFYTLLGDSRLFWRAFTPDGPYFGNDEFVLDIPSDIPWSTVRGMDAINGHLYFARTDGHLYRADLNGFEPVAGTTTIVSGPTIDTRRWGSDLLAFIPDSAGVTTTPSPTEAGAEFEFEFSASVAENSFRRYHFPVDAGETFVVRLSWLDPTAELDLRVLDNNGVRIAVDTTAAGSPKELTVRAGEAGTYQASVQIQRGGTSYTLQVNPRGPAPAAAPLPSPQPTGSPTTLPSPTGLRADVYSDNALELFWNRASTPGTRYQVSRNGVLLTTTDGTSHFVSGLPSGEHRFAVAAVSANGDVSNAAVVTLVTGNAAQAPAPQNPVATGLAAPTGLRASVYSATAAELFWDRPAAALGIVSTEVFRDGVSLGTTPGVSFFDGTRSAAEHSYTVIAIDGGGARSAATAIRR